MKVGPAQADRRVFRVRYRLLGGHYHCRVFSARASNQTFAKLGELTMDTDDWLTFLEHVGTRWEILREDTPGEPRDELANIAKNPDPRD